MTEHVTTNTIVIAWIAGGLTLIMFSFLYKDNPLFKLGEHLYVGLSVGYGLVYAWFSIIWPDLVNPLYRAVTAAFGRQWKPPLESYETLWLLVPFIFSILMLTRFYGKTSWLSRWSFAFITGAVSGMAIPYVISAQIFKQLVPTLQSLYQPGANIWMTILDTSAIIIILAGVVAVLIYFFFSTEHKKTVGVIARIGVFYMMVSFGASFGYTVMGRETLAIMRFSDLVKWGKADFKYASIILFLVIAIIIILWEVFRRKEPAKES